MMSTTRTLIGILAALLVVTHLPIAQADDRPNILWLSCEDISPHLGCYGFENATTPNVDRLAASGVRYTNATVTAGVCAPCRSGIITGMYQTTLGTQHMRSNAELPELIQPFPVYLRRAGYYATNNSKKDYQFREPRQTWDASSGKAHWRNRPDKDQPFFAVFNYTGCHESAIASAEKYRRVTEGLEPHDRDRVAATLPPYYPNTPITREDWGRYYDVITAMDRWVGEMLGQLEEDGLADDTIVIYWSDHGVGLPRAKRWLYESGMHVPVVVRIPPKFRCGDQGRPGTVDDRLVSLMDLGPTTLNLAGVKAPEHVQGQPFLGRDLPPPREYVFGARDRMDERYDVIRAVRDKRYKYIRNYEPWKTYYQYMNTPEKGATMGEIRRVEAEGTLPAAAAKFLAATKPVEELYDFKRDPHELVNLADSPEHRPTLERMRKAHLDWVLETRDLGLIPEAEIAKREQGAGSRYAILRKPGAETLVRRVRDTASLTLQGPEALPDLERAMDDPDAAVRYWAAIGIGNLGAKAVSAVHLMRAALDDESASVRIAAARALCRMDRSKEAVPLLARELTEGGQWARLAAAIALDEIDADAKPALAAMKQALTPRNDLLWKGKYTVRVINRALNELLGTSNVVP
ncbi:MAG: sulfatase-like hydrolase/transferase [Planctomycetes bacterium]|nr:sulfatase-like hydrolase/transferase [Planctomycetota bacterium]